MKRRETPADLMPIQLRAQGQIWRGQLLDTPSGRELARHLPLELALRRWWGAYAGRREQALPIWLDPLPDRAPRPGDLAWWPGDSSLCVYLPPSPEEDPGRPRLPPEVNRIGRLEGDLAPLARGGHQVRVRLAADREPPAERLARHGYGNDPSPAPIPTTEFAPGILIGPAPDKACLAGLAAAGLRSILDLREEGEPGQVLSPNVAASWARAEALEPLRAPISRSVLQPGSVDRFLRQLARAPRPVYVHSGTGRRAVSLLAIHLALEQDLSADEALERLAARGLDPAAHALRRFTQTEVLRRRPDESGSPA